MLIECRDCKTNISDKSAHCPKCGCPSVWAEELDKTQAELMESVISAKNSRKDLRKFIIMLPFNLTLGLFKIVGLIVLALFLCSIGTILWLAFTNPL